MQDMPQVYFIGGAPRVGKTMLAMRVLNQRPMFALSADAVRDMLQRLLSHTDAPALFAMQHLAKHESAMAAFLRAHSEDGIHMQNNESTAVWPSINALILSYLADGHDVMVEGVEILPSNLAALDYPYAAVFLGNTSPEHANSIAQQAHAQPHDWMHRYADDTIEAWAGLTHSFSAFVKTEAEKHGMVYVETHDEIFEQSLDEACRILLGN
jgi:2-phosphoglycerate kinase